MEKSLVVNRCTPPGIQISTICPQFINLESVVFHTPSTGQNRPSRRTVRAAGGGASRCGTMPQFTYKVGGQGWPLIASQDGEHRRTMRRSCGTMPQLPYPVGGQGWPLLGPPARQEAEPRRGGARELDPKSPVAIFRGFFPPLSRRENPNKKTRKTRNNFRKKARAKPGKSRAAHFFRDPRRCFSGTEFQKSGKTGIPVNYFSRTAPNTPH